MLAEQHAAEIRRLEHDLAHYSSPVARLKSMLPGGSAGRAPPSVPAKPERDADVHNPPKVPSTENVKAAEIGSNTDILNASLMNTPQRNPTVLDASMTEGKRAIGIER
jgi:hypothetical protein